MPSRRRFVGAAAGGLLISSLHAIAQPAAKIARIGWLTPEVLEVHTRAFREAMRALGYDEGKSYVIEARSADDNIDRLPGLAAELVRANVDLIVAVGPPAILAAKQATTGIPIVMAFWGGGGLLESGVVANLARPGGNVTGVSMLAAELDVKRLELLLQAVPKSRRVGVLDPGRGFSLTDVQSFADGAGVQLVVAPVGNGAEGYRVAFDALANARVEALLVPSHPRFFKDARKIIDLAASRKLPAIYEWPSMAEDGGLMAYGPTFAELEERVASFVQRILAGAKPAILAIEQPSKFELVINAKTAKALGINMPSSLLLRADRVVQ